MAPHPDAWTARTFREQGADAEIRCIHCHHRVIWTSFTLERAFGGRPVTGMDMSLRFRCGKCGGRGATLTAWFRKRA